MNIDIRLSTDFFTHPKIKMLQKRLGPKGVLCLLKLWIWAAQTRPDGALGVQTSEYISMAADWTGNPDKFVDALVELHLLDVASDGCVFLHNWDERQPYAAAAHERRVKAQQAAEEKQADISDKRREAANRRWGKDKSESKAQSQNPGNGGMQTECKPDANGMQTENLHMQNSANENLHDANGCKPMHPNQSHNRNEDLDLPPYIPPTPDADAPAEESEAEIPTWLNEPPVPESEMPLPEEASPQESELHLQAESQKPTPKPKSKRKKTNLRPDDFEAVWAAYPARPNAPDGGKGNKERARKIWDALCAKNELPDVETLLATLEWQKQTRSWQDGYIHNFSKYLDDGMWKTPKPANFTPYSRAAPQPRQGPPYRGKPTGDELKKSLDDSLNASLDYLYGPEDSAETVYDASISPFGALPTAES